MRRVRQEMRRIGRGVRDFLYPTPPPLSPALMKADTEAMEVWSGLFEPLNPTVHGSDVLEIGCREGRLLAALLDRSAPARSAMGFDDRAWWSGEGGGAVWWPSTAEGPLELHSDFSALDALDPASFDLVLCRDFQASFPVDAIETGLRRLYDLTRPGGECILHLRCADVVHPTFDGPGYGVMTPNTWTVALLRAGFELEAVRPFWRTEQAYGRAIDRLPLASDAERMTASVVFKLLRPWESWELDKLWAAKTAI